MYEGSFVKLELKSTLNGSPLPARYVHECQVIGFDEERDRIILLLRSGELQELRLSAKYKCSIYAGDEKLDCTGEVCRRYRGEKGNIIEFYIEDGFYKISINSVDK